MLSLFIFVVGRCATGTCTFQVCLASPPCRTPAARRIIQQVVGHQVDVFIGFKSPDVPQFGMPAGEP